MKRCLADCALNTNSGRMVPLATLKSSKWKLKEDIYESIAHLKKLIDEAYLEVDIQQKDEREKRSL